MTFQRYMTHYKYRKLAAVYLLLDHVGPKENMVLRCFEEQNVRRNFWNSIFVLPRFDFEEFVAGDERGFLNLEYA